MNFHQILCSCLMMYIVVHYCHSRWQLDAHWLFMHVVCIRDIEKRPCLLLVMFFFFISISKHYFVFFFKSISVPVNFVTCPFLGGPRKGLALELRASKSPWILNFQKISLLDRFFNIYSSQLHCPIVWSLKLSPQHWGQQPAPELHIQHHLMAPDKENSYWSIIGKNTKTGVGIYIILIYYLYNSSIIIASISK